MQAFSSRRLPGHDSPPHLGRVQVLVRTWMPFPHDSEHLPQAAHWLTMASTGQFLIKQRMVCESFLLLQSRPPYNAWLHVRVLVMVPFPHELQVLYSVQALSFPSIGQRFKLQGTTSTRGPAGRAAPPYRGLTACLLRLLVPGPHVALHALKADHWVIDPSIGQRFELQILVSNSSPTHCLPPYCGPMHLLFLFWTPPPQVTVQDPNALQGVNLPWI